MPGEIVYMLVIQLQLSKNIKKTVLVFFKKPVWDIIDFSRDNNTNKTNN